jgi:DNA repair exonuclease SbcCD ATPase subunit
MKLRSLALNQFKKFTSPTRLDGIGDGLNVAVGPNEMGKSTLLDALCAALFEKHDSKAQSILALQNDRNQAAPVVELAFELNDGQYRITKRFIKKPYARLSCPDGRTLEGDAAEDLLRTLLSFEEAGKTGAKPETLGMWNVLWVQQGQSFGAFDLPESARSNLHSALETEVGTVLGGRRGRALPEAIEKQLRELVTSGGKARGQYKQVIDRIDSLRDELHVLQTRRREMSEALDRLEETEDTLARLVAGDRDKEDHEELAEARKRHRQLVELEARLHAATTELELRRRNLEQALQEQEERRELTVEITTEANAVAEAGKRLEEVREHEKQSRTQVQLLRAAVREAEAAVTKADEAGSQRRRLLGVCQRHIRVQELAARQQKAQEAECRARAALQSAAAILVTETAIKRIRSLAQTLKTITNRLTTAATIIRFDMSRDALSGIDVNGTPVTEARPFFQAIEPTTISIPGRGRITIEPAIQGRDKLIREQRETYAKLKEELAEVGVKSVGMAEDQYATRVRLLQQASLSRQEADLQAPATDDYEAGAEALADYVEGMRQILAREMEELGAEGMPTYQEAEENLQKAQEHAAKACHVLNTSRAALSGPEETFSSLQTELGTISARYEDRHRRLDEFRDRLASAQAELPEENLQVRIDECRAQHLAQETIVAELRAQRTDETLPQLEARISRLEQAIKDRRDKRENLKVQISSLTSHVQALEGVGLDEAIQQMERELERCEEECKRSNREVQVLTLLLSTLRATEHQAKERYLSPVLNRVHPYLRLLFPNAEITIDENLHIVGVVRDAGYEESFHRLSMGTREQIAILVRLAFAEMLIEQGRPATVILDDALVFSDDRRMSRMFDILNMAARRVQIIIFTCREQLFEELGGQQLSFQPESAEELVSA